MTDTTAQRAPDWLLPHLDEVRGWPAIRGTASPCHVTACSRDVWRWGLCKMHAQRARRAWNPPPAEASRRRVDEQPRAGRASDEETGA